MPAKLPRAAARGRLRPGVVVGASRRAPPGSMMPSSDCDAILMLISSRLGRRAGRLLLTIRLDRYAATR